MRNFCYSIAFLVLSTPTILQAQNDKIWRALNDANLPLALELIDQNRDKLDPLYRPDNSLFTILYFLKKYDVIRPAPKPLTEAVNDAFAEMITGQKPIDWRIKVEKSSREQVELIRRICGARSVVAQTTFYYVVHARESQVIDLLNECAWVLNAEGI